MHIPTKESAINAWRAFAPSLPLKGLQELARAMGDVESRRDSPGRGWVIGKTVGWSIYEDNREPDIARATAACPIGYTGWKGNSLTTVAEVHEFFDNSAKKFPIAVKVFTNWADSNDREVVRRLLLPELEDEIKFRQENLLAYNGLSNAAKP